MKTFTKESLIAELIKIRNMGWISNERCGNHGSVGNTLEDLLGIEENNLPLPNASEWELKARRKKSNSLITLFHSEPSLQALKFIPSILLPQFGWVHKEAGQKYPETEKSFRQTINCGRHSDRGFYLEYDKQDDKLCFKFDINRIVNKDSDWKDTLIKKGIKKLEPYPYWSIDDIFHKIGNKLHNCFLIASDVKKEKGLEYFYYEKITMLRGVTKERILECIKDGKIYVDFDARTGHNHGTKFRIRESDIECLYDEVKSI